MQRAKKRGQTMLEYVLMLFVVTIATFALFKLIVDGVFKPGIRALPAKVAPCSSTAQGGCT